MTPFLEWALQFIFVRVIYPIAMDIAVRRETDPAFKAEADRLYGQYKEAATTSDRWKFARGIYDLQKRQ